MIAFLVESRRPRCTLPLYILPAMRGTGCMSSMLELDDTKMLSRIAEARTAILDRAEDIHTNSSSQERRAINEALQALRVLEAAARKRSAA